jgi:hypothetical protein
MSLSPNAKAKIKDALLQLAPELLRIKVTRSYEMEVVPPAGNRDVPFVLFRNAQHRVVLELLPAVPSWRSWTVNAYIPDMNDTADELGGRIERIRDTDDGLSFHVEVKKCR